MSQIKKAVGRPPAAGRYTPGDGWEFSAKFKKWTDGTLPADAALEWRVPFVEVVQGIQTIGGIAKLAGVARETVYRRKVVAGSFDALMFVINRWRGTGRPLVKHADPLHGLNLDNWLPNVVNFCEQIAEHDPVVVKTTFIEGKTNRKWNRKVKFPPPVNPTMISDQQMEELNRMKRLGQTAVYRPAGHATVKMICNRFRIPRREYYRRKAALTIANRKLLDAALVGRPPPKSAPPHNGTSGPEDSEDSNDSNLD